MTIKRNKKCSSCNKVKIGAYFFEGTNQCIDCYNIEKYDIELNEIRKIDIHDIISRFAGAEYIEGGKCPFPNCQTLGGFSIKNDKFAKCFSCGISGDGIHFVEKYLNLHSTKEAIAAIKEKFLNNIDASGKYATNTGGGAQRKRKKKKDSIPPTLEVNLCFIAYLKRQPENKKAAEYLNKRGFNAIDRKQYSLLSINDYKHYKEVSEYMKSKFPMEILIKSGLFTAKNNNLIFGTNRIIIPFMDGEEVLNITGRAIHKVKRAKYINLSGIHRAAYNLDSLKKTNDFDFIFLVEGSTDAIAAEILARMKFKNVVAIGLHGLDMPTYAYTKLLDRVKEKGLKIKLVLDDDLAGRKKVEKEMLECFANRCKEMKIDLIVDTEKKILHAENDFNDLLIKRRMQEK